MPPPYANAGIDISVVQFGAKGDGITDDTAAIQRAINSAITLEDGAPIYFPPGNYLVTHTATTDEPYALLLTAPYARLHGDDATITFDSTVTHAFLVTASSANVEVDGLAFQGAIDDDKNTNFRAGVFVDPLSINVIVKRCRFDHCVPIMAADTSLPGSRCAFLYNQVVNAPGAVALPYYSKIIGNWFVADAVISTRSHAVYLYGQTDGCQITNNLFVNISTEDIQIRAGSANMQQKQQFVIANNIHVGSGQYSVWAGSDDQTCESVFVIADNVFQNCDTPIHAGGLRHALISDNTIAFDWAYSGNRGTANAGIEISSTVDQPTSQVISRGVRAQGNRIVQLHPFFGVIDLIAYPTPGDTITVGAQVYTWVAGEPASGQIQIPGGSDLQTLANALCSAIQGGDSLTQMNAVLRDRPDAFYNQSPGGFGRVVVVSFATFVLSTTSPGTTITPVVDNRGACAIGISVEQTIDTAVVGNHLESVINGIEVINSVNPHITDNEIVGCGGSAELARGGIFIEGRYNTFPRYERNRMIYNQISLANNMPAFRWVSNFDGFPVQRNNGCQNDQENALPQLVGASGYVAAGDGVARMYLWYGAEVGAATPASNNLPLRWNDGDLVQLSGIVTTYTFTFQRTAPGAGQFNSLASLMALINGSTGDNYIASEPGAIPNGYILIAAAVGGVGGNAGFVRVTTRSLLNGVTLIDRADNETVARLRGGSAAADTTVVFTPLASTGQGLIVAGYDAAGQALAPASYAADTLPGVCYAIKHGVAAGGERFWYSLA